MKKISLLLLILSLLSCAFINESDEVIYLEYEGSYFPIYSRGNKDSDNLIIWTHGGPGSSGMYYGDIEEIEPLQDDYHIVYWDQLSSGGTMGNPSTGDFTIENFSTHLDGIVNIVKARYNPKNLYLLGHSWGGYLSAYYLADDPLKDNSYSNQDAFKGLILLNPILDIPRALYTSILYIKTYAQKKIDEGIDVVFWEDALEWYEANLVYEDDDIDKSEGKLYGSNIAIHYDYIEEAGGMLKERDRNDELTLRLGIKMTFMSPFHFYNYYTNQNNIRTYLQIETASLDNEDGNGDQRLENINLPILMISGDDDKIADIDMSTDWASQFGTEDDEKFFVHYADCGHAAFLDQKDLYLDDIRSFINR